MAGFKAVSFFDTISIQLDGWLQNEHNMKSYEIDSNGLLTCTAYFWPMNGSLLFPTELEEISRQCKRKAVQVLAKCHRSFYMSRENYVKVQKTEESPKKYDHHNL